ncbi:hypothetical protein HEP81_04613 [Streptomyces griseofuscus]|uniref:Uncharacterized protein n=1 Tax=Streptomyces griseofuscus TaxID=146922 RepID=A0A7H1Q3K6_9ACTN|nr:hypothetical protein [Streptomyces griseofuscus]QNT94886.1 hypothetical protein HEP81_04613 [Streptomyces griseofuscus]
MDVVDELREEFREGWRAGVERGGLRDELHRLTAWTRRQPGSLARFALKQMHALWHVTVSLIRDAFRGTPVLAGILVRALARGVRAAVRASTGGGAAASAKPADPAAAEECQEPAPTEEAQFTADAPAGPPWKRRKGAAQSPGKQAPPTASSAPAKVGPADALERVAIGFLVLTVGATFGGMALGALGGLLAPYESGIILGLAVVWCLVAAMVAPRDEEPTADVEEDADDEDPTENDHEMSAGEQAHEVDAWPTLRAAIRNCVEQEAAAGAGGFKEAKGRGVIVDDLVAPLQRRGVTQATDRKAVIGLLESAEIRWREQMKFRIGGKQKNRPGVHVADLAEDLGRRPRLPAELVPDLTPQPGPSRELKSTL